MKKDLSSSDQMQRFFWEKLIPVFVSGCICIFFLLLPIFTKKENCVFIWGMVNDYGLKTPGTKLTAQLRIVLLFLAAVCILPYYLLVRKKPDLHCNESWVKLGLVFGIAMLFMGCTAAPDSYPVDPAWFSQMEGADRQDAIDIFGQVLEEHQLISAQFLSRLLLTSPHSILLPLLLCMIVQIAQWWRKRRYIRTLPALLLLVFSLTAFGNYSALNFNYHAIYYAVIGTILFCGDSLLANPDCACPMPAGKEDWKALLVHGVALLALYGCIVAMFVLEARGMYERGGLFSPFEIKVSLTLCLWLVVVLLASKNRSFFGTVLPLYLLTWWGFVCTFFTRIGLKSEDILSHITPFFPKDYYHMFSYILYYLSWDLTCIACTIYTIYFLYDHGLKHRPRVIVGVTTLLIVSVYIPQYEFIPQTSVTLCSLRNLLLGAIAPILVILVGISPGEPKCSHEYLGGDRLTHEEYITGFTLTNLAELLQNAVTRNTWNITRSYGIHINEATGNVSADHDSGFEHISAISDSTKTE